MTQKGPIPSPSRWVLKFVQQSCVRARDVAVHAPPSSQHTRQDANESHDLVHISLELGREGGRTRERTREREREREGLPFPRRQFPPQKGVQICTVERNPAENCLAERNGREQIAQTPALQVADMTEVKNRAGLLFC